VEFVCLPAPTDTPRPRPGSLLPAAAGSRLLRRAQPHLETVRHLATLVNPPLAATPSSLHPKLLIILFFSKHINFNVYL